MNPLTQFKNAAIPPVLVVLMLGCFGLLPQARAVCQEGCLTNNNTVLGDDALVNNTSGDSNTAIGFQALQANTTGDDNAVIGYRALTSNTTGTFNTATGFEALQRNTTGSGNTANGLGAQRFNTTGSSNTAIGAGALQFSTTGNNNIALGYRAGMNLTIGSNNIDIDNAGVAGESRTIRIGTTSLHNDTFIAGISGVTVPAGVAVIVDTNGHLGTTTSSARFKDEIKPMDKSSEAILALKPVTFHYKKDLDPDGTPQFGLVAEEVEKVNADLVVRDDEGKPNTVRYEAINAMLLNEFLKEHRKVEQLEKQVAALTAGLLKVSAQLTAASPSRDGLELTKSAPQTVLNDQ